MIARRFSRYAAQLAVIAGTAAFGISMAKVLEPEYPEYALFGTAGALAGLIAVFVVAVFGSDVRHLEKELPVAQRKGVKIATVGFVIAVLGWISAVFISFGLGFAMATIGILVGVFGVAICFVSSVSE